MRSNWGRCALQAATDVVVEVLRLCARGLQQAQIVATHSSREASADAQLGVAMLHSAFNGARANLEGKISSLTDMRYVTSVVDRDRSPQRRSHNSRAFGQGS